MQRIVAVALAFSCAPTVWLVIAATMLGAAGAPALADKRIVFNNVKAFFDNGMDLSLEVSGTLTGDFLLYPNNSMSVTCDNPRTPDMNNWPGKCLVVRVQQIGDNQIGRIRAPEVYPIARWSNYEVVATDDPESLHRCRITIISIDRKAKSLTWIEQPNPQADPVDCVNASPERFKWTIEPWRW